MCCGAVTALATFLCLCKETWRKESTPRLRARCCASGSRSRRDFPKRHPASAENAAPPCAAPCGSDPPPPPLRRGPGEQNQDQDPNQRLRRSQPGRLPCFGHITVPPPPASTCMVHRKIHSLTGHPPA